MTSLLVEVAVYADSHIGIRFEKVLINFVEN
jgi:hypothetical protein